MFKARAVFKPSLSAPIAHYFGLNLKGTSFAIIICLFSVQLYLASTTHTLGKHVL